MDEDTLHTLASYPSFYAFPLPKNAGFELQQRIFYFWRDAGAEDADWESQRSSPWDVTSWRASLLSSYCGSSAHTSSSISSSPFLSAAEFFPRLAAVVGSTPFYLYDEARIRANCRRLLTAFKTLRMPAPFPLAAAADDSASAGGSQRSAADITSAAAAAITCITPDDAAGTVPPQAIAKEKPLSSSSGSLSSTCSAVSSPVSLFKHFTNYFAVKATPTPAILKIIYDEGLGVDCSTLSELLLAEAVGFWGERIFFTSSCTSPEAYRKAFDLRAIITVDNPADIHRLRLYFGGNMPDILCFRYTPSGINQAAVAALLTSSPSVVTGFATPAGPAAVTRMSTVAAASQTGTGVATPAALWHLKREETTRSNPDILGEWHESKFGMTGRQVLTAVEQALRMGVHRIGLHSMTLSNSLDVEEIVATAACSFHLAKHIRDVLGVDVELINLGGGLGVPYKPGQPSLDLHALAQKLQKCMLRVFCCSSGSSSMSSGDAVDSPAGTGCNTIGHSSTHRSDLIESNESAVDSSSSRGSGDKLRRNSYSSRVLGEGDAASLAAGTTVGVRPLSLPRVVMENGRFLTADAAVLVTRVTHLKQTYKNYVGVDACMANLMRPGLYGAYHHITVVPDLEKRKVFKQFFYPASDSELPPDMPDPVPLRGSSFTGDLLTATQAQKEAHNASAHSPQGEPANFPQTQQPVRPRPLPEQKEGSADLLVYDVVGGLCENNDKFAVDRLLPRVEVGDLLLIHDVGAHGHAMGFNYNGRLRSMECLRRLDGSIELIRRAEDFEDLFATVCCPGMPASAELLRLARYYYGFGIYDRQPSPFGNAPESFGGRKPSFFGTIRALIKAKLAKLFGDSGTGYPEEELYTCRGGAIDLCCASLFLSTGLLGAGLTAHLLFRYIKPKL